MTLFRPPQGQLSLRRWPRRQNEPLQAWDNADLYLLKALDQRAQGPVSVVANDNHGALLLAAMAMGPTFSWNDSWLAHQAALANAGDNEIPLTGEQRCWPGQMPPRKPDQVLMRVPKSLALLEWQLSQLSGWLNERTPIWLAGMDKHLPRQLVPLLHQYLGNGHAELGWKKARLFSAQAPEHKLAASPYPTKISVDEQILHVHAGVFSQHQLDIGARFFLKHLPSDLPDSARVADLGCGNGLIGLTLLKTNPGVQVTFCDESWLALQSARDNIGAYAPHSDSHFHLGDGFRGLKTRFDLIALNPPFHQGHVVGEQTAQRLFRQARGQLAQGGELRVVGNRHLGYHRSLERLFKHVRVLGSNRKFTVWACAR